MHRQEGKRRRRRTSSLPSGCSSSSFSFLLRLPLSLIFHSLLDLLILIALADEPPISPAHQRYTRTHTTRQQTKQKKKFEGNYKYIRWSNIPHGINRQKREREEKRNICFPVPARSPPVLRIKQAKKSSSRNSFRAHRAPS